ncbi:MAG: hypothetical protein ABSG89_07345 [Bacteroidales bacterium]
MKKSFLLIILITVSSVMLAQKGYQDTIYLKNGTSINGKIIEMAKDKSVEIQSVDKIFFYFKMDEIEKIVKESSKGENNATDLTNNSAAKRKGYIGLSIGPSIPLSGYDYQIKAGIQLTLADFGYLFTDNFGVTVLIGINSYQQKPGYSDDDYDHAYFMGGPLFSVPISGRFSWELQPVIGFSKNFFGKGILSYGLDNILRYNAGKRIAFLFKAGYFETKGKTSNWNEPILNVHIETISIGIGIAYRLK